MFWLDQIDRIRRGASRSLGVATTSDDELRVRNGSETRSRVKQLHFSNLGPVAHLGSVKPNQRSTERETATT